MNIILLSTGSRPRLLAQTMRSLQSNAADWKNHTLTIVYDLSDKSGFWQSGLESDVVPSEVIIHQQQGASRSRNIAASAIPNYLRQKFLCFFDDDIYAVKGWDAALAETFNQIFTEFSKPYLISGHAHPYNISKSCILSGGFLVEIPDVISTVNFFTTWDMWDDVGFFIEPGGPGGSEDVDWCRRADAKGYGFAVTSPEVIIHTGITSSSGKLIVGHDVVLQKNRSRYDVKGVVYL